MIIDSPHKELTAKQRIEISVKKQQESEYKLKGRMRLKPGLTLWSFNWQTMELKKADIITCESIDFETKMPRENKKVNMDMKCYYFQALNQRTAVGKINKMIFGSIGVRDFFRIENKQVIAKGL